MFNLAERIQHYKGHVLQSQRELDTVKCNKSAVHWYGFRCTHYLAQGDHSSLRTAAHKITGLTHQRLGYYYLAKSYFLCAEYTAALQMLQLFLELHPNHADANYLLSQIYQAQNQPQLAWDCLASLSKTSKRIKTWLFLAQLVNNSTQLEQLQGLLSQAQTTGFAPTQHPHLDQYLAHAALRAQDYPLAFDLWRQTYEQSLKTSQRVRKKKKTYSAGRASQALSDLNNCLSQQRIPIFLVSGTLLGCIREGKLLGHDKDIDVGVWENVSIADLVGALRASGLFYVQPQRSPWLVKAKHVNGIPIDIFYHIKEDDYYWHGGIKSRWYNRCFELREHAFLGGKYWVPDNSEQYLTENYGDWRTPKVHFDNVYDTPNAKVTNYAELVVHNYRALIQAVRNQKPAQISLWQQRLQHAYTTWFNQSN